MSEIGSVTPQHKIGSGFGRESTAAEVIAGIDLSGKTAIVTGGYSGLGLETVRALSSAGARVMVPARRPEHAREVLDAAGLACRNGQRGGFGPGGPGQREGIRGGLPGLGFSGR